MRLMCPNCEALYEVPAEAIPPEGRDVQCSNCSTTWLAEPAHGRNAQDLEVKVAQPRTVPKPKRGAVSDDVQSMLKQEAAREIAARKAEAESNMATQDDLGLDDIAIPPQPTTAQAPPPRRAVQNTPSTARKKLPEIEDINTSISSQSRHMRGNTRTKATDITPTPKKPFKSGYHRGFWTGLVLIAGLFLVYLYAGQLKEAVPRVSSQVDMYTQFVDGLRTRSMGYVDDAQSKLDALLQ